MNPRVVLRVNSGVILSLNVSMLAPLLLSVLYEDGSVLVLDGDYGSATAPPAGRYETRCSPYRASLPPPASSPRTSSESFEIVNPFGRVVLTVCMLLGRLEIFTVLAVLSPSFWRR